MKQRVLLFVPPMIMPAKSIRRLTENLPLLAIGTYLKSKNYTVMCYDMICEGYENTSFYIDSNTEYCMYGAGEDELFNVIEQFRPDVIGVSVSFSVQDNVAIELINKIKERYSNILLVAGGIAVKIAKQRYMDESRLDFIILGEGEYRLEKLLDNIREERPSYFEMDGFIYRCENNDIKEISPNTHIRTMDELPMMDRSLLNQEKYFKIGKPQAVFFKGKRPTCLFIGKGCPLKCTFCNHFGLTGTEVRYRSVDNIIKEVEYLTKEYGIDELQFYCENLTINKEWSKELFKRLIPFNISWCTPVGLYFNSMDEEMIELMARSGAYQITFAIESASQRVLKDLMNKNIALERVRKIVDFAHTLDIAVHGFFMIGMPGETREEIKQTLDFVFDARFDSATISVVEAVFPSKLWDLCIEKGYVKDDEYGVNRAADMTNIIIPHDSPDFSYTPAELKQLVDETTKKHYEWSKKTFPQFWEHRYGQYLLRHPEDADLLGVRIN